MEKRPGTVSLEQAFKQHFRCENGLEEFLLLTGDKDSVKREFKQRVVYEPAPALKFFLRFLNQYVFSYADVLEGVVHSYRPGSSPKSCLLKHVGNKAFYKADLKSFFESITAQDINKVFLDKLSGCRVHDLFEYKEQVESMVSVEGRLPVGFPTSPLISNTVLFEFDKSVLDWASRNGVVYTRYADDLVFSASQIKYLKKIPDVVCDVLHTFFSNRLQVNLNKSYFIHEGQKAKLLGLVILPCGRITVSRQLKNKIETVLYYYKKDRTVYTDVLEVFFKGSSSGFVSTLIWVASVDPWYLNKLRSKYGNLLVDLFLHRAGAL